MPYRVQREPRALRDLQRLRPQDVGRLADASAGCADGLAGNVARPTDSPSAYRLREGASLRRFLLTPRRQQEPLSADFTR